MRGRDRRWSCRGRTNKGGYRRARYYRTGGGSWWPIYRSRRGMILGVCAGLAEHFDLSVRGVRIVTVLLLIFTGFWPLVAIYILAGLVMKPAPLVHYAGEPEEESDPKEGSAWRNRADEFRASRREAVDRLKRTFDKLNRRLQNLEDSVTAKEFDWERRFNQS